MPKTITKFHLSYTVIICHYESIVENFYLHRISDPPYPASHVIWETTSGDLGWFMESISGNVVNITLKDCSHLETWDFFLQKNLYFLTRKNYKRHYVLHILHASNFN